MKRSPGHLGRMYGLLFVLLGAVGLNAGWIATLSYGIVDSPPFNVCLANAGLYQPVTDLATVSAARPELGACLRPVTRPWALIMLATAVATFAVTAALAVAGGIGARWRVRTEGHARGPAVDIAHLRFARLCEEYGLAGRRPEFHVLRAGSRLTEPFTTGVPARRPVVVVPAAVAGAPLAVFDPIIRHELAHVEARDVVLAAGAWWSGWVSVLVLAAAAAPLIGPGRDTAPGYAAGLLVAVILGAALLLLRAHVLRLREFAADRAVADRSAQPIEFADLFNRGPRIVTRRVPGRLGAMLSAHPTPAARMRALTTGTVGEHDGGFLPSAVTSLVLFIAVQPVYQVVLNWTGWVGPSTKPLHAVAAALVAVLLVPDWARRAAAGERARWCSPVVGVAAGVSAGFFLPGPGLPTSPGTLALTTHWSAGALLFLAVCGSAVLLVGLARGVDPDRRGPLVAAAAAGAGIAAVTLPAALQAIVEWAGGNDPTYLRSAILFGASVWDAEPVYVFAAVAVLAVMTARMVPPRSTWWALTGQPRTLWLMLVVAVIATTTGAVGTVLRLSENGDQVADLPLLWHRWWVSAIAGGIVLFVLMVGPSADRGATSRLAGALTAAAAVTLASAAAQFLVRVIAVGGWDAGYHPGLLGQYVVVPLRILLLLSVPAVSVAVLVRQWAGWWQTMPARARGPLVAAVTAVACAAVMFGVGETLTGGLADARRLAVPTPSAPVPTPSASLAGSQAGAMLTPDRARSVVAAGGTALPGWTMSLQSPQDESDAAPSSCAAQLGQAVIAPDVEATAQFTGKKENLPPMGADIFVTVDSFSPALQPAQHFAPIQRQIEQCGSYTEPNAATVDGKSHYRLTIRQPGPVSHPAFVFSLVRTDRARGGAFVTTTSHTVVVAIGHNVVTVAVVYACFGEPFTQLLTDLAGTASQVLDAAVQRLGRAN